MDDLIAFLREQLKVDEQTAQKADRAGLNGVSPSEPQTWYLSGNETVYSDPHGVALVTGVHGYLGEELGDHIVRHDPARVLADVDAKRRIIEEVHRDMRDLEDVYAHASAPPYAPDHDNSDLLLRLLALPYAGRPGYREEWRP